MYGKQQRLNFKVASHFEDRERSLEKILFLFYDTLYLWTAEFVSLLSLSYSNFLVRFTLPS
jgi:hypothetical protein